VFALLAVCRANLGGFYAFYRLFLLVYYIIILFIKASFPYFVKNYQKYVTNAQKKYFAKVFQKWLTFVLWYYIMVLSINESDKKIYIIGVLNNEKFSLCRSSGTNGGQVKRERRAQCLRGGFGFYAF
jgi:hypothetical protein